MQTKTKILVAMSGGVDSTVAALLLRDQGYEVIGITMKTWDYESSGAGRNETGCCNLDATNDARAVAVKYGFPHYVLDLRQEFEEKIISNFINEYIAGRTPNPCVLCNRLIKWDDLIQRADQLGCKYIATGHYARVADENGRYFLKKGMDRDKDQTYVLWGLSQENLSRTLFPLGEFNKDETRRMAEKYGMEHIAGKSESYEICFIPDNDYRRFLKHRLPDLEKKLAGGDFIHAGGKVLGKHEGYPFYTIGQRKGLKIAVGHPLYVCRIEPGTNTVFLGEREHLKRKKLTAAQLNLMKYPSIHGLSGIQTLIRYNDKGATASIEEREGKAFVYFENEVQAVTPGQSVVFFEGEDLLGGGIILE